MASHGVGPAVVAAIGAVSRGGEGASDVDARRAAAGAGVAATRG